jgi:hypothetical protein
VVVSETKQERRARLRRRIRCALLVVLAAVGLVAGEVLARVFAPQSTAELSLYVADPELSFRLRPGFEHGGVQINSRGLRDPERALEKPTGTRRVLVLGDSFSYGSPLPAEDGYARRLEVALGAGVGVVNSGVPGWGTVQQAGWLERDGLAYAPDAVVVGFFVGNDVWENLGAEELEVVEGALVTKGERKQRSWLRRLRQKSKLYRLLKRLPERIGDAVTGDSTQARWYHKIERMRMGVLTTGEAAASWEEGWRVTRQQLARIRELVAPRPVVVLVIPDEVQVDPALRAAVAERYDLDLSVYDFDLPQRRLAAITDELGLARVDVLEQLRARTEGGERLYVPLDSHWNADGHQLAVEALLESPPIAALRR